MFLACVSLSPSAVGTEKLTLFAAGSTFIYPTWSSGERSTRSFVPDFIISYEPIGSGHGIARTLAGTVDFGASDSPISDAELTHSERKAVQLPVVLGAVVPSYNLPGVAQDLRFTPAALAGIYLGTIKKWDGPELVRANPGVALPAHEIAVFYRTDSSGTTCVWTDYLSKVSSDWNKRVGRGTLVKFPIGAAAQYNEGVRDAIKQQPFSFGYLESTYAFEAHLPSGRVLNSTGKFVQADSGSITAAAAATATNMPADLRASITNSNDEDAYPISSFTWILVPEHIEDRARREAIVGFLKWVLADGQQFAQPLHYAALPGDVAGRARKALDRVQ